MKYLLATICTLAVIAGQGQTLVGTWQQTNERTCLETEFKETQTEKELLPAMGATHTSVAKLITFDAKGRGKEGIFSKGVKKGSGTNDFLYKLNGQELQLIDKKSGIMTQRFQIDELTESTMTIHNAMKECELRTFAKVK
jgi:hypothetical protein